MMERKTEEAKEKIRKKKKKRWRAGKNLEMDQIRKVGVALNSK